jgi:putative NIF3 family GTP cyclohydrolase 1 type 2
VKLAGVVDALDAYFRIRDVEGDDWSRIYDHVYPVPYWREFVEPGYEGRWNGLVVRGAESVERAITCVFPSDAIVASLPSRTFLFSEHPIVFEDDVEGFEPLARASFERLVTTGCSFYHVHAPLDQHCEVAPSRLVAQGLGLSGLEEYFPIAGGIPGGAAVIGDSDLTVDELADRLNEVLGPEIPVEILSRPRARAGRVAVAAGGGAERPILEASLERGCETYVTGQAATRCRLAFVQESTEAFRALADDEGVAVVDGTHYGLEKPPQLAMVEWFKRLGLEAEFRPGRPERTRAA